ncbi:MAG: glutamate racemase [Clostridiales bacterium]|jgi:glutamate racemase|nr:glutamate racemase [Clostridiales bacterium]
MQHRIGIFDSGVGGLTVVKEILAAAPPCREIVYFGDCLRVPYGEKSSEELIEISREIIGFLLSKNVGSIIVACGTISSKIFDRVKAMIPAGIGLFGMIEPGVSGVLQTTKTGKIGIIATEGSVKAQTFENAVRKALPGAEITAIACPSFPEIVEAGLIDSPEADRAAARYLAPLANKNIDTLLLACTHYPLLENSIKKALPPNVALVDPAKFLVQNLPAAPTNNNPQHQFYISGKKQKFDQITQTILNLNPNSKITRP